MLRTLIVDDEAPARSELRYMLDKVPDVQVVGEATNAGEALELIKALDYDLVFVDIQMPGLTGLEAASELKKLPRQPAVVFVTAYSEHAVEAFELEAADYLVKPFSEDRLAKTIEKVLRARDGGARGGGARGGAGHDKEARAAVESAIGRLPVQDRGRTLLLPIEDIVFINSQGDVVFVHTAESTYVTRFSLRALEQKLEKRGFVRTHRGYIVNLNHVEEIITMCGRNYLLRVKSSRDRRVPVSRRRSQRLKSLLGL